jgi:hypothetical protein
MHIANGAAYQTRLVADSMAGLDAVHQILRINEGYQPDEPPSVEGIAEETLHRPQDRCYSAPLECALISLFPSSFQRGDRIWVFIDPVPRPEQFPPRVFGLSRLRKHLRSILCRCFGPIAAWLVELSLILVFLAAILGVIFGMLARLIRSIFHPI